MDHQGKKNAANAFANALAESLGDAFSTATGNLCPLEVLSGSNPPTQKGMPIHFRLSVEGTVSGECFIEFYEPQVARLLSAQQTEPGTEFTEAHAESLTKLIVAATESLAAMKLKGYGTLRVRAERVAGLAFGGMFVVPLATSANEPELEVLVYFGGEMLDSLSKLQSPATNNSEESGVVAPHNLKLVMDVELNVSLRFGQRQLPLREVLDLASGSVIELDRMADEPVELYLDGKLIARGEAVVVDGNYGLRVTEIPTPVATYLMN